MDDISLAWWVMTGLPMVWELLCYRRDLEHRKPGAIEALQNLMKLSQRAASEQASSVLDVAASPPRPPDGESERAVRPPNLHSRHQRAKRPGDVPGYGRQGEGVA